MIARCVRAMLTITMRTALLSLQAAISRLYGRFVSPDGSGVDYDAMKASADFDEYLHSAAQLQAFDLHSLSSAQRKAFLLNLYNALCIHGMIALGPPDAAVKGSLGAFFGGACYLVGEFVFSLDDIEHGILRGNRIHPTTGLRYFEEGDRRAQLVCAPLVQVVRFAVLTFHKPHLHRRLNAIPASTVHWCAAPTAVRRCGTSQRVTSTRS